MGPDLSGLCVAPNSVAFTSSTYLTERGVRVHYPTLWWGRMPLMDDNAVLLPVSLRSAARGVYFRSAERGFREAELMSIKLNQVTKNTHLTTRHRWLDTVRVQHFL